MVKDELVTYTCKRCGHKWIPRIASPDTCPACKSRKWREPMVIIERQKQILADKRKRKLYEGGR